jgi:hypothetical protein
MLNWGSEKRSSALLGRPTGGLAEWSTHGRSPGSQRIADAAFPGERPVAKMRRHAAHSRGGGRGSARSLPRSLFTLEDARDRAGLMFQLDRGLSNDARPEDTQTADQLQIVDIVKSKCNSSLQ